MKHIKGTKKSMMNYKPFVTYSKQRKPNTKALDQGCIVNKIDRFDRIVDKQSMNLYIKQIREKDYLDSCNFPEYDSIQGSNNHTINTTNN